MIPRHASGQIDTWFGVTYLTHSLLRVVGITPSRSTARLIVIAPRLLLISSISATSSLVTLLLISSVSAAAAASSLITLLVVAVVAPASGAGELVFGLLE